MTTNKRNKHSRMRGSRTHKWGAKKRHRKSGNRGGFGKAGTGKRAAHKKPTILKLYGNSYFGKFGFFSVTRKKVNAINLEEIAKLVPKLKKEGDFYIFDANASGYNKILASGKLDHKIKISCKTFSKNAIEKIKKSGGEAIVC